jgi:drug/metabolite transporter (DMT)-like permease
LELWIPITLVAAFSQNIRGALQKHLTGKLSTGGATQARFFYALPFALLYVIALRFGAGYTLPQPNAEFFFYAVSGALAQIFGAATLVALYSHRNFFVGTAFSKTESIQAAVLGLVVLGDGVSAGALIGICLGLTGMVIISGARHHAGALQILGSLTTRPALLGVCAGLGFGVSAVCFRGASLSLQGGYVIQAAFTLLVVLTLQATVVALYLRTKEPGQMSALVANWRVAAVVGLAGMIASVGWFTAMTLQNAGYVRALGQIELVFSFMASVLIFKEKTTRMEFVGIAVIVLGILILLLFRNT